MAISKSKTLILALFLLSTLALAIQSPLPASSPSDEINALLTSHGLPPGLFPDSVFRVKADTNGILTVTLKDDCYARLTSKALLHYERTIAAVINFGTIRDIVGVQLQQPSGWAVVTEMKYNVPKDIMEFYLVQLTPVPMPMDDFSVAPTCMFAAS